jgi:hypothetical protein
MEFGNSCRSGAGSVTTLGSFLLFAHNLYCHGQPQYEPINYFSVSGLMRTLLPMTYFRAKDNVCFTRPLLFFAMGRHTMNRIFHQEGFSLQPVLDRLFGERQMFVIHRTLTCICHMQTEHGSIFTQNLHVDQASINSN